MIFAILLNLLGVAFVGGLVVIIWGRLPLSAHHELVGTPARFAGALFAVTPLVAIPTTVGVVLVGLSGAYHPEVGETLILIAILMELLVAGHVLALIVVRYAQHKIPPAEPRQEIADFEGVDSETPDFTFSFLHEDEQAQS